MEEQLELFPITHQEAKDFLFRKGVNSLAGTIGGEVQSYYRHYGFLPAEQYLFTRYASGEFMIMDATLHVVTEALLKNASEYYLEKVFPKFFTKEELEVITAYRKGK